MIINKKKNNLSPFIYILPVAIVILNYYKIGALTFENYVYLTLIILQILFLFKKPVIRILKPIKMYLIYIFILQIYIYMISNAPPNEENIATFLILILSVLTYLSICNLFTKEQLNKIVKLLLFFVIISCFVAMGQKLNIEFFWTLRSMLGYFNSGSNPEIITVNIVNDRPGGLSLYSIELVSQIVIVTPVVFLIDNRKFKYLSFLILLIGTIVTETRTGIIVLTSAIFLSAYKDINYKYLKTLFIMVGGIIGILIFFKIYEFSGTFGRDIFKDARLIQLKFILFDSFFNSFWGHGFETHHEYLFFKIGYLDKHLGNIGLHSFLLIGYWQSGIMFFIFLGAFFITAYKFGFLLPYLFYSMNGLFHNYNIFIPTLMELLVITLWIYSYPKTSKISSSTCHKNQKYQ